MVGQSEPKDFPLIDTQDGGQYDETAPVPAPADETWTTPPEKWLTVDNGILWAGFIGIGAIAGFIVSNLIR